MGKIHPPFDLAQIFTASNDFLAWITPFLRTHSADHIQIPHLRHKLLLGRDGNRSNAVFYLQPRPSPSAHPYRAFAQALPYSLRQFRRKKQLKAVLSKTTQAS